LQIDTNCKSTQIANRHKLQIDTNCKSTQIANRHKLQIEKCKLQIAN